MNEQNPEAVPVESIALPEYKDRSVGLIVFGILTILLGGIAVMFVLLMLVQAMAGGGKNAPPVMFSTTLMVAGIYGTLAVTLVWLGIGSIMARRWARALMLIFSWSWLVMGIFIVILMAFVMPKVLANAQSAGTNNQQALPPAAIDMMMVVMLLVFGVFFIIVPAVWTFFYNSRHVKATCEARDPVARWTDACPLPVLAMCLWLLISVPWALVMPITGRAVMPFFGMFLTGLPGALFCLALTALWSYAAWLLYKLDQRGWWLVLIAMVVFMVSGLMTYARHDITEMYHLMGYPPSQIEQMQKTGLFTGNRMSWMMSFSMLPFLGYLLFIKKYFRGES